MNNITLRILSAVILLPPVLYAVYAGGFLFTLFVVASALLMFYEWQSLASHNENTPSALWQLSGVIYITLPCACLLWLRNLPDPSGFFIVIWTLVIVWATDIGAYIAGRAIGGFKIAPAISPNKTWAGLAGGMVAAFLAAHVHLLFPTHDIALFHYTLLAPILAVIAQIGDFFESWAKRRYDVKDSSNLIPGHGGILDRLDGLLFVSPVVAGLFYFYSGVGGV